jgi:hypothetical protein
LSQQKSDNYSPKADTPPCREFDLFIVRVSGERHTYGSQKTKKAQAVVIE